MMPVFKHCVQLAVMCVIYIYSKTGNLNWQQGDYSDRRNYFQVLTELNDNCLGVLRMQSFTCRPSA